MDAIYGWHIDQFGEDLFCASLCQVYSQLAHVALQLTFSKIGRVYQSKDGHYDIGPFVHHNGTEYVSLATSVDYYTFLAESDRPLRAFFPNV